MMRTPDSEYSPEEASSSARCSVEDHGQHAAATARYSVSGSLKKKAKVSWRGSGKGEAFRPPRKAVMGCRCTLAVSALIGHPFANGATNCLGCALCILKGQVRCARCSGSRIRQGNASGVSG